MPDLVLAHVFEAGVPDEAPVYFPDEIEAEEWVADRQAKGRLTAFGEGISTSSTAEDDVFIGSVKNVG